MNQPKLKTTLILLFTCLIPLTALAQKYQLRIIGLDKSQTQLIDSLGYNRSHANLSQLTNEINHSSQKLSALGYINNQLLENKKEHDSSYCALLSLGKPIKSIHIYISAKNRVYLQDILQQQSKNSTALSDTTYESLRIKSTEAEQPTKDSLHKKEKTKKEEYQNKADSLALPYGQAEAFLKACSQSLEQKGFAFAKLQLQNISITGQKMHAELLLDSGQKRMVNTIVIKQPESLKKQLLPKGALKQISRKYKNRIFNQQSIQELHDDFEKFDFINQIKYPEILFTKDSTKAFVYIDKKKANLFDGFIGFNNTDQKKIKLSGYLDLSLVNPLGSGESLSIYWKNNQSSQKIFNASLSAPYLFKGPIGLKAQINLYKQDSLFQNTKTALQLSYSLDPNKRFYLGYESTESSDIQNQNLEQLRDFKNHFYSISSELKATVSYNSLFPTKSFLYAQLGSGQRLSLHQTAERQYLFQLTAMNDFYISKKHLLHLKTQNYYLKSDAYLSNELFRFGGIGSIRGFAENSLQANYMSALISEYRYILSEKLYVHSILDYCYYQDPTLALHLKKASNLLGLGLGLGLVSQNGILRFSISNGRANSEEIRFSSSILTTNYSLKF